MMWNHQLINPIQNRKEKPRSSGITMIMDKGLGLNAFEDLLETSSPYIDFIKLGFGTAGITPPSILKRKITLAQSFNIPIYPGGTFFEVALSKNLLDTYFQNLLHFQFEWVEISDGSIYLSLHERKMALRSAQQYGLKIITEIGKKIENTLTSPSAFLQTYEQDLTEGASYVIVEGRENGEKLSVFDENGKLDINYIEEISKTIGSTHLIWEAPQRDQQVQLLKSIGSEVNFGNIAPYEILSVESLRRGLRSDSFNMLTVSHK